MQAVTVEVPDGVDPADARRVLAGLARDALVEKVYAAAPEAPRPGHAAQVALREQRWREIEDHWGLLDSAEVAAWTGASANARSNVSNLRRRNLLCGVKRGGALRYPAFQFTPDPYTGAHKVAPAWTRMVRRFAEADWSEPNILLWAAAPNSWLEGDSPADEIAGHPDELTESLLVAITKTLPSTEPEGW